MDRLQREMEDHGGTSAWLRDDSKHVSDQE